MDVTDRHGKLITRFTPEVSRKEASVALDMACALDVRPDDWTPPASYDRKALALSWDKLASGEDTKDQVLARSVQQASAVFDGDSYTLHSGRGIYPYTGQKFMFTQVPDVAGRTIDIDHVVALCDAFTSGGWQWGAADERWQRLANDKGNLLAVSSSINRSKGNRHAAAWLPPAENFRRRYVILQTQIKTEYHLSVTGSERETICTLLS